MAVRVWAGRRADSQGEQIRQLVEQTRELFALVTAERERADEWREKYADKQREKHNLVNRLWPRLVALGMTHEEVVAFIDQNVSRPAESEGRLP